MKSIFGGQPKCGSEILSKIVRFRPSLIPPNGGENSLANGYPRTHLINQNTEKRLNGRFLLGDQDRLNIRLLYNIKDVELNRFALAL